MVTRRHFLGATAAVAGATVLPRWLGGQGPLIHVPTVAPTGDPDLASLAARAIDAARAAGATYADVRLTRTQDQRFWGPSLWREGDLRAVGVRVLVDGRWGFQSSARWTPDEMARLARGAVAQAKGSAAGVSRTVELGQAQPVAAGQWVMPVKYDPFDIPVEEKMDVMNHYMNFTGTQMHSGLGDFPRMEFERQAKVFASSDGSSWAQTTYLTLSTFGMGYRDQYSLGLPPGGAPADFLSIAGKGWEAVSESGLLDAMPRLAEEAEQTRHRTPVDIGRYDAVFSAQAMAAMVASTIGTATELDRALGYEANATGTSYLSDPLAMLGTYRLGSPLLTVTANRSVAGGAATVQWDDEGVGPEEFTLVKDGVLVDYQTTREQAAWLAPYYTKAGRAIRSHGCAGAASAKYLTMQHAPNLRLVPGARDVPFDDLVRGIKRGVAVLSVEPQMDQQQLNGIGQSAVIRKITNGKLGPYLNNAGLVFRAPDFWKHLTAIGGAASERLFGFERYKGEPSQRVVHSVSAVPGVVTNVAVIDALRRA
jgi:TldD protein